MGMYFLEYLELLEKECKWFWELWLGSGMIIMAKVKDW